MTTSQPVFANLLPLFVAIPLVASAVTALIANRHVQRLLLLGIPLASSVGGAALVGLHAERPVLVTQMGGFVPGIAIPFVSDTLAAVMLTVTGLTTAIVLTFALRTGEDRLRFFTPLVLMLVAGVNGALLTADAFNLFVFVEVMLLPSYALVAMTGTWRRMAAGRVFLVVNLVTSSIFLIGLAVLYAGAGTVNLAALAGRGSDPRVAFGAALVLLALVIKAGAVPVHGWLPRAYPATSATVMALFAGLHSKVALVAIYRIHSLVFGESRVLGGVILALIVASMIIGAWSSFGENTIRRVVSFQMVSGVGHALIGVALSTLAAWSAGLIYTVHSILTLGVLVLAAGAVEKTYGTGHLVRLADLLRREKALAWIVGLALLSIMGLPPSSGFWGKIALVLASAKESPPLAALLIGSIVAASIISLLAMQRLWHEVFWGPKMTLYRPPSNTGRVETDDKPVPLPDHVCIKPLDLAPAGALLALSLVFFVAAGPLWEIADRAAVGLVDVAPYVTAVIGS
ncbi:MAG TPA: proton-conducting transporter membrane subunit [Phycicoccus sp.]|jgi:multicomponent Na+:H+ antiporter subunit D|nr:proton-conducting transporter membrane subunit [Phycicoccus sp.]HRA44382.1 proton-conducting transporter membrane subunit [Phycicoccus sp.]